MISNYIRRGFWSWIALSAAVWLAANLGHFESYSDEVERIAPLGLLFGGALLAIAVLIVRSREQAGAGQRLSDLYRHIQRGETVEICGESGLIRLLLVLGFGTFMIAEVQAFQDYPFQQGLLIVAAAAGTLLEALTIVPLLRQPILRISRDALESPVFGKLPWSDIDGIDLSEAEMRGIYFQHRLHLSIARLPSLVSQMHPATRIKQRMLSLFRASTHLRLRLKRPSEMPKVILTLCQRLSSEYARNRTIQKASLPEPPLVEQRRATQPKSKSQLELEAKLNASTDARDFLEALRSIREENAKRRDAIWEMSVSPPRIPTHWTTWVAAAIAGVGLLWLIYLLYASAS